MMSDDLVGLRAFMAIDTEFLRYAYYREVLTTIAFIVVV